MHCIILGHPMLSLGWIILRHFLVSFSFLFLFQCSHTQTPEYLPAQLPYFFNKLHVKGYEGMMDLIEPRLREARNLRKNEFVIGASSEMAPIIRGAYVIVLSRANHDRVVSRLIQNLHGETQQKADFYDIMLSIARQSVPGFKNKDRSPLERATYLYILENVISSVRPHLKNNPSAKNIMHFIVEGKIKIPEEVHNVRYLHALEPESLSPSVQAQNILKSL